MAYSTPYTFTALELLTAAKMNAIQTNISAIWTGTTAGDLDYYTSSTAKTRLAIGSTAGDMLYTNTARTAPAWATGRRFFAVYLNSDVALSAGDGQGWFMVPPEFNGWNIVAVYAMRDTGGTGVPTFQLRRAFRGGAASNVDVLSTRLTIDTNEITSGTAATPAVINAANDDLQSYDVFHIDVDVSGTNTIKAVVYVAIGRT